LTPRIYFCGFSTQLTPPHIPWKGARSDDEMRCASCWNEMAGASGCTARSKAKQSNAGNSHHTDEEASYRVKKVSRDGDIKYLLHHHSQRQEIWYYQPHKLGFIFLDKMSIHPICLTSHSTIQVHAGNSDESFCIIHYVYAIATAIKFPLSHLRALAT
jgi:hypothetical protein